MPKFAVSVNGKKFMWDGELYSDKTVAAERVKQYQGENFETFQLDEGGVPLLYTRRVAANVIVEGGEPS